MDTIKFKNGVQYYNKLYFLFNVVVAIPLLPFVFLYLDIQKFGPESPLIPDQAAWLVRMILPMVIIVLMGMSYNQFSAKRDAIRQLPDLRSKLQAFYQLLIRKYAFIEGASVLTVLGLFLTREMYFVIIFVVILVLLSLQRPTLRYIIRQLDLNKEERDILYEKQDIPM